MTPIGEERWLPRGRGIRTKLEGRTASS
jgi:hypothetical protein